MPILPDLQLKRLCKFAVPAECICELDLPRSSTLRLEYVR